MLSLYCRIVQLVTCEMCYSLVALSLHQYTLDFKRLILRQFYLSSLKYYCQWVDCLFILQQARHLSVESEV